MQVRFGFLNTPYFPEPDYLVRRGKSYEVYSLRTSHETRLFRDGILFGLPELMCEMYKEKTNVLCYASSGGHEPCTLGITLADQLGSLSAVRDRFHIHAVDINPSLIELGRDGLIILSKIDVDCFPDFDGFRREDFFINPEPLKNEQYGNVLYPISGFGEYYSFEVTKELREVLTFTCSDLMKDLTNDNNVLYEKPVVFMFRNAWFNFRTAHDARCVADLIFNRLKSGSLLVLGQTESNWFWESLGERKTLTEILEETGFKHMPEEAYKISGHTCKDGYLFIKE